MSKELLERLSANNFKDVLNAELFNEVAREIGCTGDFCKNHVSTGNAGSNLFIALMYQNLLLVKKVDGLEDLIFDLEAIVKGAT